MWLGRRIYDECAWIDQYVIMFLPCGIPLHSLHQILTYNKVWEVGVDFLVKTARGITHRLSVTCEQLRKAGFSFNWKWRFISK